MRKIVEGLWPLIQYAPLLGGAQIMADTLQSLAVLRACANDIQPWQMGHFDQLGLVIISPGKEWNWDLAVF